ncbi:MAG TPA: hypothetical protein VF615_22395 [Longimicrobiaceae bacterium]|jgi:hypothetical protein
MRDGTWKLNGETIIFSDTGKLLDGRRRLQACVLAGVPFRTIVVQNVSEEHFTTIDTLRVRKAADILYIRREPFHRVLSSVPNLVYRYYQGEVDFGKRISSRDTLFVLDIRPEIRDSVEKTKGLGRMGWHTVAAAAHHLASRVDSARADAFFERVINGVKDEGDPAGLLRAAFEGSTGSGQARMLALAIRAWNAEYSRKPIRFLRWRQEGEKPDKFPTVADLPEHDGQDLQRTRHVREEQELDPSKLAVTAEFVTPQMALLFLEHNDHNRKVVSGAVDRYARDMREGHWALNGQTLKISSTGRLLDGQHRCSAAVKAERGFHAIVVRGLPDDVFDTLDAGSVRSFGEVLASRGERNTNSLAAALQKVWLYDQRLPQLRNLRASHTELLGVLEQHPEIRDCVNYSIHRVRVVLPGAIGCATHYLASRIDRARADQFVDRVADGVGLSRNDPVRHLRELMNRDRKNNRGSLSETEKWALTIKAVNAFFEGNEVKLLVWRPGAGEGFPRILGEKATEQNAA